MRITSIRKSRRSYRMSCQHCFPMKYLDGRWSFPTTATRATSLYAWIWSTVNTLSHTFQNTPKLARQLLLGASGIYPPGRCSSMRHESTWFHNRSQRKTISRRLWELWRNLRRMRISTTCQLRVWPTTKPRARSLNANNGLERMLGLRLNRCLKNHSLQVERTLESRKLIWRMQSGADLQLASPKGDPFGRLRVRMFPPKVLNGPSGKCKPIKHYFRSSCHLSILLAWGDDHETTPRGVHNSLSRPSLATV